MEGRVVVVRVRPEGGVLSGHNKSSRGGGCLEQRTEQAEAKGMKGWARYARYWLNWGGGPTTMRGPDQSTRPPQGGDDDAWHARGARSKCWQAGAVRLAGA